MRSPYQTLGVKRDATPEQIKRAYRAKATRLHPDHGGDPAKFRELSAAYKTLFDPVARAAYDAGGAKPPAKLRRPRAAAQPSRARVRAWVISHGESNQFAEAVRAAGISIMLDAFGEFIPEEMQGAADNARRNSQSVLDQFFKSILQGEA